MSSTTIETLVKMMESVPDSAKDQVLERLRQYLADVLDDIRWDETYKHSQAPLESMAREAMAEFDAGLTRPFDPKKM